MRLSRENRAILKSLGGEYKKFGKRLKSAVFSHCKGDDEINDCLGDMLGGLSEAQEAGRPLADVIPDEAKTIHETVVCLPLKKIPHTGLIFGLLSAALAAMCIAALLWYFLAPLPVGDISYIRYSSEDGGRIYWNDLPNAARYEVEIDFGDKVTETKDSELFLTLDAGGHRVKVTAYGEGRYSEPVTYHEHIDVVYPIIEGGISDFISVSADTLDDDNYSHFLQIYSRNYFSATTNNYVVTFTPEITFYGKYFLYNGWTVHSLTVGGLATDAGAENGEMQFIEGLTYTFTLSGKNGPALLMNIGLLKAYGLPVEDGEYNRCQSGETLFSLSGTESGAVYADSRHNENLRFAAYDKSELTDRFESGFGKELYHNVNTAFRERHRFDETGGISYSPAYLLVKNDSDNEQYLHLAEQQAVTADSRGIIEVGAGYTVIELNNADYKNHDFVMYADDIRYSDDFVKINALVPVTYTDGSTGVREQELLAVNKGECFIDIDYVAGTKIVVLSQTDRKFAYAAVNIFNGSEENYIDVYDFFDDGGSATLQFVLKPGITRICGGIWYSSADQKVSHIDCMFVQTVNEGDAFDFIGGGDGGTTAALIIDGYLINLGGGDIVLEAKNASFDPRSI